MTQLFINYRSRPFWTVMASVLAFASDIATNRLTAYAANRFIGINHGANRYPRIWIG